MPLNNIDALKDLVILLKKIPFIASRHFYKLVDYFLLLDQNELKLFFKKLEEIKETLIICEKCCSWKEKQDECFWCGDKRENDTICIVETWIEAVSIEKSGIFKGQYHILGGSISLINDITPDKLNFSSLIDRLLNDNILEIIIAINQTPEGNATASYIERIIKQKNISIKLTYLASGVPVGVNLEFVDRLTLSKAFTYRR